MFSTKKQTSFEFPKETLSVRLILHVIFGTLSWLLFFYLWYVTFATRLKGYQPARDLLIITITAIGVSIIDIIWIRHNLKIYRIKGPRKSTPEGHHDFNRDYFGRKITAKGIIEYDIPHSKSNHEFFGEMTAVNWATLKNSNEVKITLDNNSKHYLALKKLRLKIK